MATCDCANDFAARMDDTELCALQHFACNRQRVEHYASVIDRCSLRSVCRLPSNGRAVTGSDFGVSDFQSARHDLVTKSRNQKKNRCGRSRVLVPNQQGPCPVNPDRDFDSRLRPQKLFTGKNATSVETLTSQFLTLPRVLLNPLCMGISGQSNGNRK